MKNQHLVPEAVLGIIAILQASNSLRTSNEKAAAKARLQAIYDVVGKALQESK